MNSIQIKESLAIILSTMGVFIVSNTFLSSYSSYMLGFLIIFFTLYISIKKRSKSASELFTGSSIEISGVISIILLIILLTGNLGSPLFFFLYFLLFIMAFISHSTSVWLLLLSIILYFTPEILNTLSTEAIIKFGSLILITPIAYFVGKEFERRQMLNSRIEAKSENIIQEAEVLKSNTDTSSKEELEVLDEIIEDAESLKKDTLL